MSYHHFQGQKATAHFYFWVLAFFYFPPLAELSFGQAPSEPATVVAEIGIRLPDAGAFDPRVFPFEEQPALGLTLNGPRSALLRWQPVSLERKASLDSTGRFITVREYLFDEPLRLSYIVPFEDYYQQRLAHDRQLLWHRAAAGRAYAGDEESRFGRGGLDIDIPVPIKSKAFTQIFGGSTVGLNVQGDIRIEGGLRRETRDQVITAYNRGANTNFKMTQTQRFTVTGRIGEKVTVNVDQDSERAFEFENNIKLNYTGFDDEVVKKIEAGNIALNLPGTRYVTFGGNSAGLFGIKSEMQLGNLFVTTIASQEKGENKKLTLTGGATEGSQRIEDYQYRRNTYFFLDTFYRQKYREYTSTWVHADPNNPIQRIEVYKSAPGYDTDQDAIKGVAYRRPDSVATRIDSAEVYRGSFKRLRPDVDYYLEPRLGYIRMETPINEGEVLAVAYVNPREGAVGDIDYADPTKNTLIRLKLIKDRTPRPTSDPNHTWHLEWKNVYYLGSRNIPEEGFEIKIFFKPASGDAQETFVDSANGSVPRSYLTALGLDVRDINGRPNPDDIIDIDAAIIDRGRGELIFPDPRPFDPDGGPPPLQLPVPIIVAGDTIRLPVDKHVPFMYDTTSQSVINSTSKFYISVKSKNRSSNYSLGFNVIEGSEEVLLRGRKLERDRDYVIDYFSGNLTILAEEASQPDATVEVSYQSNQLFQLEKKTILGTRAEYRLGRDSFLGGTLLYLNERSLDQRVRLGSVDKGPMQNLVWDFNTKLQFRPNFLSRALDALPFLSTQEPSDLRLEGEIAQIIPNPNTLNNEGTGDVDGVAYVDDFEGSKRTTPFGVHRRGWVQSSIPINILDDETAVTRPDDGLGRFKQRRALARRGKLIWSNPFTGIPVTTIYPNRDVNANVAQTVQVMSLNFTPVDSISEATASWGGIMRALSAGFFDQTESKFLEIWMFGNKGRVHIDLGQISEDAIPNGRLNTEDFTSGIRNGILDEGEDIGLDGIAGKDPNDFWNVNGNLDANNNPIRDWGEPASMDDWFYPSGSNQFDSPGQGTVNGTENSKNEEGGPRPDTEDINGNGGLDLADNYYSYMLELDPAKRKYVEGGVDTAWVLYRIPLNEYVDTEGQPNFANIEYVRIWVDGFEKPANNLSHRIQIAEINLVSNEWKEIGVSNQDISIADFRPDDKKFDVTVVNVEEDLTYKPPPGVERERDRITQILAKEQSLVLRCNDLQSDEVALAHKTFYQPLNFIHYNRLKMFIYGRDVIGSHMGVNSSEIEFFLRFGADDRNYYEFRTDVFAGWDTTRNSMDIDLAELTNFKLLKTDPTVSTPVDSTRPDLDYYYKVIFNESNGKRQELRARGNPSLTNIRTLVAGVRNKGGRGVREDFTGEIWLDELRVSQVQKDKGIAMRARADLKLADFMTANAEIEQLDADFHNVATRFGTGDNSRRLLLGSNFAVDKFLPRRLGLSMPVSLSYSESNATPKYFPGSDIIVLNDLDDRILRRIRSFSNQTGVNVSLRRSVKSQNFLVKNTIDNLSTSFNYTRARANNSTTAFSRRDGYTGNLDYSLPFGQKNFIQPFGWIGKAPLFGMVSGTKLYFTPQRIDAKIQATQNIDSSRTRTLTANGETLGRLIINQNYGVTHSYGLSYKILENLTTDFSRVYSSRVRPDSLTTQSSTGSDSAFAIPMSYIQGLQRFWGNERDLLNSGQTFNTRYNPTLTTWLTTNFSYSSQFRYNNNVQQGQTGRSAGVNTTINATGSLRLATLFQSFRKKPPTSQPPDRRQPPGRTQPGEEGDTKRQPPGTKREGEGAGGQGTQGKQDEEQKGKKSVSINPVKFFTGIFTRLKDIQLSYNQRKNHTHSALDSGTVSLRYMFGLSDTTGLKTVEGVTTNPITFSVAKTYSAQSGYDLTRNINIGLRFEYDTQENVTTTRTGSSSLSWFQLGEAGGGLPFPEWTLNVSGLEKLPFFRRLTSSVSASTNFTGKKSRTWRDSPEERTGEDFSFSFRPLLKVSVNWKNGMITSAQYNTGKGYKPVYNPNSISDPLDPNSDLQSAAFSKSSDFTLSHTYSKRSGFRVPLPFLRNKELKNSVDLSISYTRSLTEAESQFGSDSDSKVPTNSTKRWEFSPRVNYSFSTRVRGGAHYTYGKTTSKLTGETKINEFLIDVNISIRGN